MNEQQKEEFFAEEKEFRLKQAGCLLILSVVAVEVLGVVAGTTDYLTHQDEKRVSEPEKIMKHPDTKSKILFERTY